MKTEQNRQVVAAIALRAIAERLKFDSLSDEEQGAIGDQIESVVEELEKNTPVDADRIRVDALLEAVAIVNQCREEEETDLRAVRHRIQMAVGTPDPDGAARG